ncbi:hypothetical protein BCAR13_560118 [Paraburkholderia caribensis]|nr:hypothetical protein BCAR13_560118 [Paraburkholderia caribensis]
MVTPCSGCRAAAFEGAVLRETGGAAAIAAKVDSAGEGSLAKWQRGRKGLPREWAFH